MTSHRRRSNPPRTRCHHAHARALELKKAALRAAEDLEAAASNQIGCETLHHSLGLVRATLSQIEQLADDFDCADCIDAEAA